MVDKSLTQPELKERLDYNPITGIFTVKRRVRGGRPVGEVAGWCDKPPNGYIRIQIKGKGHYAHRLAWLYVYGTWPSQEIDHINGNRSDNRIENLRLVSRTGNMKNKKRYRNNTSGVTGVYWYKPTARWVCYISKDGKLVNLGYFKNKTEAIRVRRAAESDSEYHPNHGRKN